jgi:hypothetical protein
MTLQEIENGLPNGFHDAQLLRFAVDLASNVLTLNVEVDRSSYEQGRRDPEYYPAKITVRGLCYFKLDAPDVLNKYAADGASLINAGGDPVQKKLIDEQIAAALPDGSFLHWIFLDDWNAIMVIGGMDARIELGQRTVS